MEAALKNACNDLSKHRASMMVAIQSLRAIADKCKDDYASVLIRSEADHLERALELWTNDSKNKLQG